MSDPIPAAPPQGAVAPPPPLHRSPPPPRSRQYQPRAFGMELSDGIWLEGTLCVDPPQRHLNVEGTFAREDEEGPDGGDVWHGFTSMEDLRVQLDWDAPRMQALAERLQRLVNTPVSAHPPVSI